MKHNTLLLTLVAASAVAAGCEQSDKAATTREDAARQLDKVRAETKTAVQDMKENSYAQKTEFVEKMNTQLAALNRDLDELAARIEKGNDTLKAEAGPKLQVLRDQNARLNQDLDAAKNATESTWDGVKESFKKAYAVSADGVRQARQWVSDKIAP